MGSAVVESARDDVMDSVKSWGAEHGLRVFPRGTKRQGRANREVHLGSDGKWEGNDWGLQLEWTLSEEKGGTLLQFRPKVWWPVSAVYTAAGFGGVWLAIETLDRIDVEVKLIALLKIVGGVVAGVLFLFTLKGLSDELIWIERNFWDALGKKHKMSVRSRGGGQFVPGWWRLAACIAAMALLIRGLGLLGYWGGLLGWVLAGVLVYVSVVTLVLEARPEWSWRLWIVEAVMGWNLLCISVAVFLVLLLLWENNAVLMRQDEYEEPQSIRLMIHIGRLRWTGTTRTVLERDGREFMEKWAVHSVGNSFGSAKWRKEMATVTTLGLSAVLLVGMWFGVGSLTLGYIRGLLTLADRWRLEVGDKLSERGPHIPPGRRRGKWAAGGVLVVLSPYLVCSAIAHLLGLAIGYDSLSYLLTGQAVLAEAAHGLSWIGVWSSLVFDGAWSWIASGALYVVLAAPLLLVLGVYARRITLGTKAIAFYLWWTAQGKTVVGDGMADVGEDVSEFVRSICDKVKIRPPLVVVKPDARPVLAVRPILMGVGSVLEVSNGAVKLLSGEELRWGIAHELGHIKQGLWRVSLLKVLSGVLLFPNYCLTMCLDWASLEIEADQFALEVTGDWDVLRSAVVKLTVAQLVMEDESGEGPSELMEEFHGIDVSWQFFFGERLIGRTYPFLSERIGLSRKPGKYSGQES